MWKELDQISTNIKQSETALKSLGVKNFELSIDEHKSLVWNKEDKRIYLKNILFDKEDSMHFRRVIELPVEWKIYAHSHLSKFIEAFIADIEAIKRDASIQENAESFEDFKYNSEFSYLFTQQKEAK